MERAAEGVVGVGVWTRVGPQLEATRPSPGRDQASSLRWPLISDTEIFSVVRYLSHKTLDTCHTRH